MRTKTKVLAKRGAFYILGFVLFYAPFALFQRLLAYVFHLPGSFDIHSICSRVALTYIVSGIGFQIFSIMAVSFVLTVVAAFFFGPIYCRKLCVAGAFPEYLSRLVPEKFQLKLQRVLDPVPVRYGMLAGFLLAPAFGYSVVCAFCNYTLFSRFALGVTSMDVGVLASANVITAFMWLVVLGVFTKGGRGYCSYICPVGAVQSLSHAVGAKFGFTYKIVYDVHKCVSCGLCVKECPMSALQLKGNELSYQRLNCITCNQCVEMCPKKALACARGADGWERKGLGVPLPLAENNLEV